MATNGTAPADSSFRARVENAGKWLIGYNNVEANRLGVPIVSSKDWIEEKVADPKGQATSYLASLFPFTNWIGSYNLQWGLGDLIAGITVGLVVVPQSMSYAIIAGLSPEFGLYSSFVGVVIYAFFATSKDVTIGPVAVMSLQTGTVIRHVMASHPGVWTAPVIASCLAFICGVITLGIGILRIGWIVELIPTPAVAGFMTGSAITIAVGQLPKLFGVTVDTTQAAYLIFIHFLQQLPHTKIDAAFGLTALFFLYATRSFFNWLPRRYPSLARASFFASVLRNAFVIIILTVASRVWLGHSYPVKNGKIPKYPISILKTVPSGFKHMGQPNLDIGLWSALGSQIPVSVIILLLEHIAIAKSFGRLNDYKINNNQELIAIGVTNLIGPAFGAYAATGSFSRTAIKSKSGVRTPLAGWVTAIVVIIALFALTGTFYWIPSAALSAVIIHAVGDLIAPPSLLYKFWLVSPFELIIFLGSVFATVFKTAEWGVYVSVIASLALLVIRIARPNGTWLGRVRVHHSDVTDRATGEPAGQVTARDAFVPLDDHDGLRDPSIYVEAPPPGVLIFRFQESFTYPNASFIADLITDKVKTETRPGQTNRYERPGDRPWNDPGPLNPVFGKLVGAIRRRTHHEEAEEVLEKRPVLRALIFDLSSVANVDTTSIQLLVDVRSVVERYANQNVEFHFANILGPWIRRALLAGGFGTGVPLHQITEVAPVVANREGLSLAAARQKREAEARRRQNAIEAGISLGSPTSERPDYGKAESGLGTKADAPAKDQIDVESPGARYALYGTNKTAAPEYEVPSLEKDDGTSESDADSVKGGDATRNASNVSVPIVWGQELTPFFHLDLHAALASTEQRSL